MKNKKTKKELIIASNLILILGLILIYFLGEVLRNFGSLSLAPKIQSMSTIGILIILIINFYFFFSKNHFEKGIKYGKMHYKLKKNIEKELLDAGYGIEKKGIIILPKIEITMNRKLDKATIKIENNVRNDKKLENIRLSSALGSYKVDECYIDDDENAYVFEVIDSNKSYKLQFESFEDFKAYINGIGPYKLFLDDRTIVDIQSTLLVGQTGSGKTYGLYSLLLQLLNKYKNHKIYYADPKSSSLSVIGKTIAPSRTATEFEEIINLLEKFHSDMTDYKNHMPELLEEKGIDSDYSDIYHPAHIFVIDEFASFSTILATKNKATRDYVKSMLYDIVLQGRQLGFFLFLVMQKSDSHLIDTALRENIPLKICLGQSGEQTYVTLFGNGVDLPIKKFRVGDGVYTAPGLAEEPKLIEFPTLDFDILEAFERSKSLGGLL